MTLKIVKEEIERFLSSDEPEVMAIKGSWGVGKTYTWNKFLNEAKGKIKLETYSYLSLFGVNSLDSLKRSIFEQTISIDSIGDRPDSSKFESHIKKLISPIASMLGNISGAGDLSSFFGDLSFLSVSKRIICIDDFERKSDQVSLKDILGLVLLLKEQRNCKVVLIFNQEKIEKDNLNEYNMFREKVVDFEIEFQPTVKDCIEIALPSNEKDIQRLKENIEKLNINNIRIIKKIERTFKLVLPILSSYDDQVLNQAIHTLCLYSLCFYYADNDKSIPTFEYVKKLNIIYCLVRTIKTR